MDELFGDVLVTTSNWFADVSGSSFFVPVTLLILLGIIILAARGWRWLGQLDARDAQRRRDRIPDSSRPEDV